MSETPLSDAVQEIPDYAAIGEAQWAVRANKHGVKGQIHNGMFIPMVCGGCRHLDWDARDEYSPAYYFCLKNLFLPVRKGTCKRAD